ncbi:MAG TPA: M12 family metallo-peptidase, partial [Thermoanaerobaculia bacterium]
LEGAAVLSRNLVHPESDSETGRFKARADAGNVAGATYQLRIAIETDDELYAAFGSVNAVTTYISNLVGAASVMFERDLGTTLLLGQVNVRSGGPGTDPWTATIGQGTAIALGEFGTYWHNNHLGVQRSAAVMVSGKLYGGGIAWSNWLCANDFYCGNDGGLCNGNVASPTWAGKWGGSYAFVGSSGSVTTTVPNPTLTINGIEYGLPISNYWMLLGFAHELGHVANGPHTHCISLSAQEQADYGVARSWVDQCASGECYIGSTSAPAEKGTIMSYCHNIFYSGSYRASRFLFAKAGEPNEKILDYFTIGLESNTPDATMTTGSEPVACSSGRTASVPSCSGCTYSWSAAGATMTAGETTRTVTYTPTAASVTLTVTITNSKGCAITVSKVLASSCAALAAPTNIVATATTATNVQLTWTAAGGAASYNVYRSTNGSTYGLLGNTASTTFNDSTAVAGTAYLYKVRSVNGGESGDSNRDLATTVIFTDPTITAQSTAVRLVHFEELRTAVNAVRTLAGLSVVAFTSPEPSTAVTIRRVHLLDLRTAIDLARATLGLSAIAYTDSTIMVTSTPIKAAHIDELRAGVR